MRKYLRYLRIVFSVSCGIVCVLVIVLWVRSYFWSDYLLTSRVGVTFDSIRGKVYYGGTTTISFLPLVKSHIYHLPTVSLDVFCVQIKPMPPGYDSPSGYNVTPDRESFAVSYWLLVSLPAIISIVPWLPWSSRFSLRTLLIATTLVAVVLGLVVGLVSNCTPSNVGYR